MRKAPAGKLRSPPAALQGQQTGGRRAQHSTVYRGRSQPTPGTLRGRKLGPRRSPVRVEHSGSISRRGLRSPRDKSWSSERSRGGWASHSPERPAELQHYLHTPVELASSRGNPEQSLRAELCGGSPRVPARGQGPSLSPHQLAPNSPTPGLSQSCRGRGSRRGAGRTIAAREGEALRSRAPATPGRTRKSLEKAGARGAQSSAAEPEEGGAGRRGSAGSEAAAAATASPVAAARWQRPAPRPASGGSAAELERGRRRGSFSSLSCCRRRADGRTRGAGGRAAGPAGRGGADRPR